MSIFSKTSCATELIYTSFESPNIELPELEIKMGVASSGGSPRPPGVRLSFEGDYLSRATNIKGMTVHTIQYITIFDIPSDFCSKFETKQSLV